MATGPQRPAIFDSLDAILRGQPMDEVVRQLAKRASCTEDEARAALEKAIEHHIAKPELDEPEGAELHPTGAPYRSPPSRASSRSPRRGPALAVAGALVLGAAVVEAWIGWRRAGAAATTSLLVGFLVAASTTGIAAIVLRPRDPERGSSRWTAIAWLTSIVALGSVTPLARAAAASRRDAVAARFAVYLDESRQHDLGSLLDHDEATLVRNGDGSLIRSLSWRASRTTACGAVAGRGLVARRRHGELAVDFAQIYLPQALAADAPESVRWLAMIRVTLRHGWGYERSVLVRVEHFDVVFVDARTRAEVARLALEAMPPSQTTQPADRYDVEPAVVADEISAAVARLRKCE